MTPRLDEVALEAEADYRDWLASNPPDPNPDPLTHDEWLALPPADQSTTKEHQ